MPLAFTFASIRRRISRSGPMLSSRVHGCRKAAALVQPIGGSRIRRTGNDTADIDSLNQGKLSALDRRSTLAHQNPFLQAILTSFGLHLATTTSWPLPPHETFVFALAVIATFGIVSCVTTIWTCHSGRGFAFLRRIPTELKVTFADAVL